MDHKTSADLQSVASGGHVDCHYTEEDERFVVYFLRHMANYIERYHIPEDVLQCEIAARKAAGYNSPDWDAVDAHRRDEPAIVKLLRSAAEHVDGWISMDGSE